MLKLIAYRPKFYFSQNWNRFDFFVVTASVVDLVLELSGSSTISFIKVGP